MGIVMKWYKATLLAATLSLSGLASAATVTLYGDDVSFSFDDSSLFGTGTVVGNSLFFLPGDFTAESLNSDGVISANETLVIDVAVTTDGFDITSLAMVEQGDYIWDGADASVSASGQLLVASTTTTCGFFACSDSSIFNVGPFADTGGALSSWSGGTSVDLADTAGWGSDTSLQISFQNDLTATTLNNGEYAMIQKKAGAIGLVVNAVPVPAAVWLFMSGLLGLVAMARRKTS